jgi:predicted ArsR family transcriptional regulator
MRWWERHFGKSTRGRVVALLRRDARTVEELAAELGLTDNAVRAQLATLERDGVVAAAGIRREGTVGKPATLYAIAPESDTLFSAAYAPTLAAVLAELGQRIAPAELRTILRNAGRRLAPESSAKTFKGRVDNAAQLLADLGADADLVATDDGFDIRSHGCPLSQAVNANPHTCRILEQLIAEMTGGRAHEHCDRSSALPRCAFAISEKR